MNILKRKKGPDSFKYPPVNPAENVVYDAAYTDEELSAMEARNGKTRDQLVADGVLKSVTIGERAILIAANPWQAVIDSVTYTDPTTDRIQTLPEFESLSGVELDEAVRYRQTLLDLTSRK